jgi:hypothetical protein
MLPVPGRGSTLARGAFTAGVILYSRLSGLLNAVKKPNAPVKARRSKAKRSGRIFLLSPANCSGPRAKIVLSERATFDLAVRLRSEQGVAIGEVFAFISGLYFKGKLAYALTFARPPDPGAAMAGSGALVITPNAGLRPVETAVTATAVRAFAGVDIASNDPRYRQPLLASARALDEEVGPDCEVVLLGSIASAKYVDVLTAVFGPRLTFPIDFVGRGDMSRGGLLLRCARSGEELPYVPVQGAVRHGPRPPRLAPIKGILDSPIGMGKASELRERATGAERAAKRAPASDRVGESEGRSPSGKR